MQFIALMVGIAGMYGCSNTKKIPVNEIEYLYLDYDPYAPNNYGVPITGSVCAQMQSGESRCLKNNSDFTSSYNLSCYINKEQLTVTEPPLNYGVSRVPITLTLADKKGNTIQSNDTIVINFLAGVTLSGNARHGTDGVKGKNGNQSLLMQDGQHGEPGNNGSNGGNGDSFDVHIWMDSLTGKYYFHVVNLTTGVIGKYETAGAKIFTLSAPGGQGGRGGDGGDGGNGKDGMIGSGNKVRYPGNGGIGGQGGSGGDGGNGGSIRVTIHPNAVGIRSFLKLSATAGYGGTAGKGGKGGNPGKPAAGQTPSKTGQTGAQGWNGRSGSSGMVTVMDGYFDPQLYR